MVSKRQSAEREEAIALLRETLKPGSTVYTSVAHVSRSGMSREIKLYAIEGGEPAWLSGLVARAVGLRLGKRDGVIMGGCGMDMGFAAVYELSATLYPDGFGCVGEGDGQPRHRCPSNDHSNGDRDYTPHAAGEPLRVIKELPGSAGYTFADGAAAHWHRSGGYALRQSWL